MKCVEDINKVMQLEPQIDTSWPEELICRILRQVSRMLLTRDEVKKETIETLIAINAPVPHDVAKKYGFTEYKPKHIASVEKAATTKSAEKNSSSAKRSTRQGRRKNKTPDNDPALYALKIVQEKGECEREELMQKIVEKFPERSLNTIRTMLADCMNPKYTRFKEDKIVFYIERRGKQKIVKWRHFTDEELEKKARK